MCAISRNGTQQPPVALAQRKVTAYHNPLSIDSAYLDEARKHHHLPHHHPQRQLLAAMMQSPDSAVYLDMLAGGSRASIAPRKASTRATPVTPPSIGPAQSPKSSGPVQTFHQSSMDRTAGKIDRTIDYLVALPGRFGRCESVRQIVCACRVTCGGGGAQSNYSRQSHANWDVRGSRAATVISSCLCSRPLLLKRY